MAILKDLIVHGSSRFLNKIYASEIQTPLIDAEAGVFKKLKADDATIVGLLDVQGQMHTNSWTNSNIATIDGSFYITPTLSSSSGTVSFSSATAATFTGTYSAVSSLYVGNNTASTVQWTSGSKILITGEVQVDGEWTPLGTLLGTLNSTNPTTSMPIVSITDNRNNPSAILADIYSLKSNTSLSYRNLKVSLYQRADNSEYYPLGIFMTALGQNGKTFLDIYGGVNTLTTSYGGYADPNVRIGNLSGLPAITTAAGNFSPVGWGIYTTNGYFSGTIVSNTGVIGGWRLGASSLYNGTTGLNNTTEGIYLGTDGIRNYKDTNTYVNITEGVITAKGVNLTGQINAMAGNIGGASITGGVLTVPAAYISGELTAATNNGSKITANSITAGQIAASAITADELAANAVTSTKIKAGEVKADNIAANAVTAGKISVDNLSAITANLGTITAGVIKHDTVGGTNGIWFSADTDTSSNVTIGNSTARKDWRLLVNNKFGVTKEGNLYASNVDLTGKITATSGSISGSIITSGIDAGNITAGTLNADRIGANSIDASKINVSSINIGNLNGVSDYAQKTYVDDAIDDISIGGRNLTLLTSEQRSSRTDDPQYIVSYAISDYGQSLMKDTDTYFTVSFDYKITGDYSSASDSSRIYAMIKGSGIVGGGSYNALFVKNAPSEGHYTATAKLSADQVSSTSWLVRTRWNGIVSGCTYSIKNLKFEIGNIETSWTPAPEDIEDNIEEAEKVATSYITQINDTGIKITPYDKSNNNYLQLDANTISMYRANIETLRIDDNNIRIGKENYQNLLLKSNEILLKTGNKQSLKISPKDLSYFFKNGNSPFYIKQLEKPQTATGDGSKKQFVSNTSYFIQQLYGISINGIEQKENEDYTYSISNGICTVDFVSAPANNATIIFDYDIEYEIAQLLKTASDADPSARKYIGLPQTCMEVLHVYVNNTETSAWHYPSFSIQGETITIHDYIQLNSDPGQGASIKVLYKKQAGTGFYMTMGIRQTGENGPGAYSLTVGKECMAEGQGSFAGGKNTAALGKYSFAYGDGGNSDSDCVEVNADCAGAIGKGLRINRTGGFACGTYNCRTSRHIYPGSKSFCCKYNLY